jgi:hypothetical protein
MRNNKKQSTVKWLEEKWNSYDLSVGKSGFRLFLKQAIEMEKQQSHSYAEFAIRCDREEMKILNFEDYIKL